MVLKIKSVLCGSACPVKADSLNGQKGTRLIGGVQPLKEPTA
jgi:hypothetical protein